MQELYQEEFSPQVILGSLPLAVDFVNANDDLLPGKTLEYYAVNIGTDAAVISLNTIKYNIFLMKIVRRMNIRFSWNFICSRNMTDLMIKENVIAFIGPDESCLESSLVASAWNLPIISYVSFPFIRSTKTSKKRLLNILRAQGRRKADISLMFYH